MEYFGGDIMTECVTHPEASFNSMLPGIFSSFDCCWDNIIISYAGGGSGNILFNWSCDGVYITGEEH